MLKSYLNFTKHATSYYKTIPAQVKLLSFYTFFYIRRYLGILRHSIITFTLRERGGGGGGANPSKMHLVYKILKIQKSNPLLSPLHVLHDCGRPVEVRA